MAKTDGCHNCVYGWRDGGLWMRTLFSGFPAGPMCANHSDTPGVMREIRGGPCRNYRRRPPEPDAQAQRIVLTNGMVAYVDACDYDQLSRYKWRLVSGGYAGRYESRKCVLMHRQIMNPPDGMQVDHIRGNRLDKTRANLRVCTPAENARNRAKNAGSSSRYVGVFYNKQRSRWIVLIRVEGRYQFVGSFDDEEEAARAYDRAAVERLGEFARLNFPEEWPPERRNAAKRKGKKGRRSEGKKAMAHAETQGRSGPERREGIRRSLGEKVGDQGGKSSRATGHKPRSAAPKGRKIRRPR
ncbi:MAG TPA: AP2 domain-containing protein [Sedimentisphaerales bacterium]|jgi:hypothetical protein|nr:AP2 domain-containing protein [Sedimentisphaerales bacterium]HNU31312.1 AP2 domain-containing protein [Sedimentisphaerales bacterium]